MPSVNAGPADCSSGLSARIFNNFRYDNPWAALKPGYVVGVLGCPSVPNGFGYHVSAITTGTTGAVEPTWPIVIGNSVVDGGVTWTCDVACQPSGKGVNFQGLLDLAALNAYRLFCHGISQAIADEVTSDCPAASATCNTGQTIPDSAQTIVVFNTVERDTDAAYNSSTGRFTVPAGKGGDYLVSVAVAFSATVGTLTLFKNGSALNRQRIAGTQPVLSAGVFLAAGDVIDARAFQSTGSPATLDATAALNFFTVKGLL